MLGAIDENNNKVRPRKGDKAICPFCFEKVIAVCGDINIHHWRHEAINNCDSWKEPETEWHRDWKQKFPKEWQEYIIEKNNEKHIADIRTNSGLILELQNSSISNLTIQIRENFYQNMVWLINADYFKNNFQIRSLVTSNLRSLDNKYKPYLNQNNNIEDGLKDLNKLLAEYKSELNSSTDQYNRIQNLISDYTNKLSTIENIANELLTEKYHYGIFRDFNPESISNILNYNIRLVVIEKEFKNRANQINEIVCLPNSTIKGFENYKVVSFEQVSPKSFYKCKVVKTNTINTFFPEVIEIRSESNYRWYLSQKESFTLLIDLSNHLSKLKLEKENFEKEKKELSLLKEKTFTDLLIDIENWLIELKKEEQKNLNKIANSIIHLNENLERTKVEIEEERERLIEKAKRINKKLENEKKEEELVIKNGLKGKYSFYWKYRRKSWDYAACPLFLDFKDHIFEIVLENELKKITQQEFINIIKNWR
ncbi:MAG: hypothetical protein HXX16_09935 [Bacteroidales bacterium]|nr:hypothetical protein [Bacteroidales bacterium]